MHHSYYSVVRRRKFCDTGATHCGELLWSVIDKRQKKSSETNSYLLILYNIAVIFKNSFNASWNRVIKALNVVYHHHHHIRLLAAVIRN